MTKRKGIEYRAPETFDPATIRNLEKLRVLLLDDDAPVKVGKGKDSEQGHKEPPSFSIAPNEYFGPTSQQVIPASARPGWIETRPCQRCLMIDESASVKIDYDSAGQHHRHSYEPLRREP